MSSAAAATYKRLMKALEKWPVDKSKAGRDYGEFLRKHIEKEYKANNFDNNLKYWDQQYVAIEKLTKDENRKRYKRRLTSTALGLTAEQCNEALSNEFLAEINKKKPSFWQRLVSFVKRKDE